MANLAINPENVVVAMSKITDICPFSSKKIVFRLKNQEPVYDSFVRLDAQRIAYGDFHSDEGFSALSLKTQNGNFLIDHYELGFFYVNPDGEFLSHASQEEWEWAKHNWDVAPVAVHSSVVFDVPPLPEIQEEEEEEEYEARCSLPPIDLPIQELGDWSIDRWVVGISPVAVATGQLEQQLRELFEEKFELYADEKILLYPAKQESGYIAFLDEKWSVGLVLQSSLN